MYWLSNYRHKIETLGRAAWWQKDHCPLTGNEENRENILGSFLRPPGAGELLFDRLSGDVEPVAIVVATSARLPMVVADLCRSLRAAVGRAGVNVAAIGLAGLGWLGLAEKAITPLGYYWPPRARVQDICFGPLMPLDGEFNNGLVEVIRFIRLHDLLVKTQLGGRQRRELEYLKHDGHEQDKPVRPVLEVLEVSILIPLLAGSHVAVHNGHERERL